MDYKVYIKGSYLEIEEIQGTLKFSVLKSNVTVLQHDTDKGRFYFYNVPNFDKLVDIENIKKEDLSAYTEESFVEFYTSLGGSSDGLTNDELTAQGLAKEDTQQSILNAIKAQGGEESVIDSAAVPVIWTMVLDTASDPPVVTYYEYGTTTVGTPTFPVKPYEYVAGNVTVAESALPTGAATSEKQIEANETLVKLDKNTSAFYTEDVEEDTSNNTTFVGKQTNAGVWLLQKIVEATVGTKTTTTMEYASVLNNATKTTYASAWTDRATLTYSEIKNLL